MKVYLVYKYISLIFFYLGHFQFYSSQYEFQINIFLYIFSEFQSNHTPEQNEENLHDTSFDIGDQMNAANATTGLVRSKQRKCVPALHRLL